MTRALALAIAAALIAAFGAGWFASSTRAARAASIAAAEQRIVIAAMQAQTNLEAAGYEQERQAIEDRADAADAALDRLRKTIIARDGNPVTSCGGDGGAIERKALGDCAAEYRRVAGIAERYRAQLVTLQAWARVVAQ